MNVIVTGAAGFIGSHLVDKLIHKGHKVVGIDDLSGGDIVNVNKKSVFYVADVRDYEIVNKIFNIHKPNVVFHLASNAAENKAQFSPIDITSRNYDAFIKVLTAGINNGMKKIIVTSSIAVYGAIQTPFKETDTPRPEDLYGISKFAMEETIKVMSDVHGFDWVITRPHNVYGPRQSMRDPYRNVVSLFINSILKNKPVYIYGNGEQKRCFSYVDDVVKSLSRCGTEKTINKSIYNIGSDNFYSINQLFDTLKKIANKEIKPVYLDKRPREVFEAISDHTLAKKNLDYKEKISLKSGLKKTWNWAKKTGPQELEFTKIEIESNKIPKNWSNYE